MRHAEAITRRNHRSTTWVIGVTACIVLFAGTPAIGQHSADYEAPTYTGSATGEIITGQDGFYIPVPDSQDGLVYAYMGNTLGLPPNPTGGEQFVGCTGGDVMLPVPFARAQRDVTYGTGTGVWTTSFDIAVTFTGVLPSGQNIGSFSTQPFDPATPAEATFIALATWTDPATAANWNADYVWFDAAGGQIIESVADPGFQNLLIDNWYRWSTTFDLDTNQILEVSITDLITGTTVTNAPVDKYLDGGAAGGNTPPTGFRYFAGSTTTAGNTVAFDNLDIVGQSPPALEIVRGDVDGNGATNALVDGIFILNWGFSMGAVPPCLAQADCDGNGAVNALVDGIFLLNWGFSMGTEPPPPGPLNCGAATVADEAIGCANPAC